METKEKFCCKNCANYIKHYYLSSNGFRETFWGHCGASVKKNFLKNDDFVFCEKFKLIKKSEIKDLNLKIAHKQYLKIKKAVEDAHNLFMFEEHNKV